MTSIDALDQGEFLNYNPCPWVKKMPKIQIDTIIISDRLLNIYN